MIIKVCGIMTPDDAVAALRAGADWIGLNLVGGPRRIDLVAAKRILDSLPRPDVVVALVSSAALDAAPFDPDSLSRLGIRRVQVYGDATPEAVKACAARGVERITVHHIPRPPGEAESRRPVDLAVHVTALAATAQRARDDGSAYLLVDTATQTLGGSGLAADWGVLRAARQAGRVGKNPPVILAGGLTPTNVASAMLTCRPDGVDVSSGVESAPGRKDEEKMRAFVTAVRDASGSPDQTGPDAPLAP